MSHIATILRLCFATIKPAERSFRIFQIIVTLYFKNDHSKFFKCSSHCVKKSLPFLPKCKIFLYCSIIVELYYMQFNAHKITSDQIQDRTAGIYTNCLHRIITLFSPIHIYQTATLKCLCHEAEGSGCILWALHGNPV